MSCEGIRHQLNELASGLPEDNADHWLALGHQDLIRSACNQGTHTAFLADPQRRVETMRRYVDPAATFLAERGIEPQIHNAMQ